MLAQVGLGVIGVSGCLRLQSSDGSGEETRSGTDGTNGPAQPESEGVTESTRSASGESTEATLSETWTADEQIDHIWTSRGRFYINGGWVVAEALTGSGIQWSSETVTYEGITSSLGADAFATDGRHVVFGFIPNDTEAGAHFHAFDRVTEEKVWSFGAPSDGKHNAAVGATHVDGVAALGINGYGTQAEREPFVVGVDIESGRALWRIDQSTLPQGDITYLGSYNGEIYVGTRSGGVTRLDPTTGSPVGIHESWRITRARGESGARIHGDTLFSQTNDGVNAYALGDAGQEWTNEDIDEFSTNPSVDNGLVVVGTPSGSVYALNRNSGQARWETTIDGVVSDITTSALRVWVADRETGLTAYDRDDGTRVHRSAKPLGGADIAIVDDVLLLGGDGARAYSIE